MMRCIAMGAVTGVTLLAAPIEAQRDAGRGLAFIGCWEDATAGAAGMTCVLPQAGAALKIVTVPPTGARTESILTLDGTKVEVTADGCTGWERARVSRDDERIVMDSEIACNGLPRQQRAGAFVIAENGDWLQVQGGGVASIATTQARRLRPVVGLQVIPTDLRPLVGPFLAEAEATRASIAGRRVSAQNLIELDDLGTADPIIDLIVAASYPESFAIVGGGSDYEARRPEPSVSVGGAGGSGIPRYSMLPPTAADWALWNSCVMMWGMRDPWACGGRAPFAYYGLYAPVYNAFGFGWWGAPFGGAFWPTYVGGPVVVQPIGPGGVPTGRTPESGGRVVKGGGYSAPSGGSGGARPRSGDSDGSSVRSGGSSPSGGSSSGSAGSSGGSSSGSSGRTAKPRDP